MGLLIQDLQTLERGSIILYYCPELGWAKAEIIDMGLNYFHMKGLEGSKEGLDWKHDIYSMMVTNRYHLYIPPPVKKPAWFRWWIRQMLMKIIKRLSR